MKELDLELKPMDIGDILDKCFRLYRTNFIKFVLITAIPQVLMFVVSCGYSYLPTLLRRPTTGNLMGVPFIISMIGLVPVFIVAWFLGLIATGALAYAISERYLGKEISVKEAYIYVLRRLWILLGASLLTGLIAAAGFLFCVIPGIILMILFIFTTQTVVIEKREVIESIARSRTLASGNKGKIFVIGLLYLVIAFVIVLILQVPFIVLGILRTQPGLPLAYGVQVVQNAAQAIANIVASPIYMISLTLLYYDIRIRREGFDLEAMLSDLGEKP